jgi:hypothetical protein
MEVQQRWKAAPACLCIDKGARQQERIECSVCLANLFCGEVCFALDTVQRALDSDTKGRLLAALEHEHLRQTAPTATETCSRIPRSMHQP